MKHSRNVSRRRTRETRITDAWNVLSRPDKERQLDVLEALLLLDSEARSELDRFLRQAGIAKRREWVNLIDAVAPERPAVAVELLYRFFLSVFPDPDGLRHYVSLLNSGTLNCLDISHLLALSKPFRLLLSAPFSVPFHVSGYLRAKIRSRRFRPETPVSASPEIAISSTTELPSTDDRPSVAIVIHRAGSGFSGGAERLAMDYARYLSDVVRVEILTTTALDYLTWRNDCEPGLSLEESVIVRRFRVRRPRNPARFQRISGILLRMLRWILKHNEAPSSLKSGSTRYALWRCLIPLSLIWMRAQGPDSPELLDYLKANRANYDLFLFVTYLYNTSFSGLPMVADRAVVVPTAHPEWPLQLPFWKDWFERRTSDCIFLSEEERRFLRKWFPKMPDGPVIGCGLASAQFLKRQYQSIGQHEPSLRRTYNITKKFALYTGRIDPEKGCRRLMAYFLTFLRESGIDMQLVLMGSPGMVIPEHPAIIVTGFVDHSFLEQALRECSVFIQPSPYESFSFSLLEAMAAKVPVLVSAESDVLRGHIIRSSAGLFYRDLDEFIEKMEVLLREPERFSTGPAYIRKRYSHEAVLGSLQRYILERIGKSRR